MARKMKSVSLAELEAAFVASPSAPTEETVVATVTMVPDAEAAPVEAEALELPAFTQAPNPPIAGVPRRFTDEEKARVKQIADEVETRWAETYKEVRARLAKEGEIALKKEEEKVMLKAFADESYSKVQEAFQKAIKDAQDAKDEQAKVDAAVRARKANGEQAQRDAQFKEDCAKQEADARARKARQEAHRVERAEANRQRASKKGSGGNGKDNGNGKKGGKGK